MKVFPAVTTGAVLALAAKFNGVKLKAVLCKLLMKLPVSAGLVIKPCHKALVSDDVWAVVMDAAITTDAAKWAKANAFLAKKGIPALPAFGYATKPAN